MKRWFKLVLPVILLAVCLLLSGCSQQFSDADAQMREIVQALNNGDPEPIRKMFAPNSINEKEFEAFAEDMLSEWQEVDPDEVQLIGFNMNTRGGTVTTQMTYLLPGDMENNVMQFETESTKEHGTHLSGLTFGSLPEDYDVEDLSNVGELLHFSAAQIIWMIVCFALLVVTIVDLIRKKPKGYGWFIAIAILVSVPIPVGNARYTLPVGSILYWCLRKVLLKKKRQLAEETAEEQAAEQAARMARLAAMREAAETPEDPAEDALPVDPPEEP